MARKSDIKTRQRRVSATEAGRSFSKLLDQIATGRTFLVHRHGEDVCVMTPPISSGRRASECLRYLRGRETVEPDPGFGRDLLDIVAGEVGEDGPPWGS